VLVHEQDPVRGGCAFRQVALASPNDLRGAKLYSTLAIPLHPTPEHRAVSMINISRALGAAGDQMMMAWWPTSPHGAAEPSTAEQLFARTQSAAGRFARSLRISRHGSRVARVGEESRRLELTDLSDITQRKGVQDAHLPPTDHRPARGSSFSSNAMLSSNRQSSNEFVLPTSLK